MLSNRPPLPPPQVDNPIPTSTRTQSTGWRLITLASLLLGLWMGADPLVAQASGFVPPRRGIPGRREGGGTRDPFDTLPWRVLLPYTSHGLSQSQSPRIFWLMRRTPVATVELELMEVTEAEITRLQALKDKGSPFRITQVKGTPVHKTRFQPTASPTGQAIASLALPQSLKPGVPYFWVVRLKGAQGLASEQASGWLELQAPNRTLAAQLAQAKGLERVDLLKQAGLWYDALAEIEAQSCQNPTQRPQLRQALQTLLVQGEEKAPTPTQTELIKRISEKEFLCKP